MPALCKFYPGLTPADIDLMTWREVSEFLAQMNKALAETE